MGIQIIGNSGVIAEVQANTRALNSRCTPIDIGSLGAYRLAQTSGLTTGVAAAAPVYSWRWGDATRLAVLRKLRVRAAVITGFTAAQQLGCDAVIARAFTASDTAGTAATLTGNNQKKRTSMGTTLLTDARISAAAALTAGTRTLDAQAFIGTNAKTLAAAATVQLNSLEMIYDDSHYSQGYPIIFAQNEGFVVRNQIAMGAAGTVQWWVEVAWDEVTSFP